MHFQKVSSEAGYTIHVPEEIINNFGYEELDKGNIQKAIAFFEHNIEQNPNSANAYGSMADGYEKAGMRDKAIVSAEKAVELAEKYNNPNLSRFIKHVKKLKAGSESDSGK